MSEWKQVKLEDFVELITDYVANGSFASLKANVQIYKEPNYALMVKTADFANDFTKSLTYTDRRGYDYLSKSKLFGGELLLSNIGSVGKVFRVPYFDRPMTLASNSIMIRCKEELYYKWLYYFFLSPIGNQMLNGITTGTTMKKFNKTGLRGLIISVPGDDEKKRIVTRIEELFSELDNGVETLRKTKQELAVYRQAVMKSVFHDIMSTSEIRPMGDILAGIEGGKSFKCEERPPQADEYGIVKVSAVTWGIYDEEESKTCQPGQFLESKRIGAGDFLFSRANTLELVGNCVVVDTVSKNLMLSDKILRFHFKGDIMPKYVMYYLRTHEGKKQIQEFSTGNQESMRNIGQDRIKRILVPVCSIEEQGSVIREIETRLSVCDSIEKTVDTALQQAEAMRQSVLKQAFEGRI